MSTQETRSIASVLLLFTAFINLLVILGAISGRLLLGWAPGTAFYTFFYAAQFGLILALLSVLQLGLAALRKNRRLLKYASLSLLMGLLPLLASLLIVGIDGFQAPMIHDITTDTEDPPGFSIISSLRSAEENSLEYGGAEIADLQRQAFPDITSQELSLSPEQAFERAEKTLEQLGWTIVTADRPTLSLEAYEESRLFGFIDDVVIRISPLGSGSMVDMRSVSRIGEGDLGANARRIRRFFEAFKAQS